MKITTSMIGISLVMLFSFGATPAHAAEDGDEKCGPDRYILKFDGKKWRETARKCSRSGDYSSENSRSRGADEGDEKCGPDGYILKFESEKWRETARRCK